MVRNWEEAPPAGDPPSSVGDCLMPCVRCDGEEIVCAHPMRMGEDCPEGDLMDCETCHYARPCSLCCAAPAGDTMVDNEEVTD